MTTSYDVIIVGGGAIGAACAREFARERRRVLVLDNGADGAAWQAAAGMLAPQIESDDNESLYELGMASRDRYAELAGELRESTGIDIGLWREGIARVAIDEADAAVLKASVAWQRQQGHLCDWLDAAEVKEHWSWLRSPLGALWSPLDGALDPVNLVHALLADATQHGATVVRQAARRIERDGDRAVAVHADERYSALDIIVAAGAWSGRLEGLPRPLSVEPVRGQMAAFPWPENTARAILYTGLSYVLARGSEALIGSTMEYAGYDVTVTDAGQQRIWAGVRDLIPGLGARPEIRSWAGLRPVTPDGLPIVGPAPDLSHLWYATGHGRNGILLAAITAVLLQQMIRGEPAHEHLAAFSPARMWVW
ncbi:MAG TPA: glycine oxidase ThiO [Gemmatimonadales bacterium]|nr:glycine oxidase ThiO [Gemmatimonadales bacterium]